MPDYDNLAMRGVTCPVSGKRIYTTRKDAKRARNQVGNRLSIYKCEYPYPEHFHLGHSRGISREEHRIHREKKHATQR